jgi:hypothetical protein
MGSRCNNSFTLFYSLATFITSFVTARLATKAAAAALLHQNPKAILRTN